MEGSLVLSVTCGAGLGTESYGASYDGGGVSGLSGGNAGRSGSVSVSLSGAGFGLRRSVGPCFGSSSFLHLFN